jgi:hypothetical protein
LGISARLIAECGWIGHAKTIRPVRFQERRMIKSKRKPVVGCVMWLGVVSLVAIATAASADQRRTLVDRVKAANDRFKDVSVAVSEGYAPIPCASGVDGGAMGVHYVSEKLLKADAVDIAHPQAVMYEPTPDGR